tara:strand:+ start:1544 stop:2011 length:468 start_codon:yes stop_codon:yes gene_type:complete
MNTTKRFDKALYNVADTTAKEAMIKWLRKNDYINIDDKETMSFDIVSNRLQDTDENLINYFFEVEIKYSWKGEWSEKWEEVRIPYRKHKLVDRWLNKFPSDLLTFVIFRNDCQQAWFISGDVVSKSEVKEVSNRNVSKGEKFYHINTKDAKLVTL